MYRKQNEYGFTLVEVMVTVALIGILTAIASVRYGDIRERANLLDAESAMQNIVRVKVELCVARNQNLNSPNTASLVCAGSENWPNIGQFAGGWGYVAAGFEGNVLDRAYTFSAQGPGGSITCTEEGCTTIET